jgi:hypothetical protein
MAILAWIIIFPMPSATPDKVVPISISSNLAVSWVASAVDAAALSTVNILQNSTLNYENGVWRLLLSPAIATIFTEKITTREARWIGHDELIEILWERFLWKLAGDIRALEDTNTQVWNGKDNVRMTIEILLPSGKSRQIFEAHDDSYTTGLELTKKISFKIPAIKAFSDKNLGSWSPVETLNKGDSTEREWAIFCYITRAGGDILVLRTYQGLALPQSMLLKNKQLTPSIQFQAVLDIENFELNEPTGSLGSITGYLSNVELTALCYIWMVHSDQIVPSTADYLWISPEDFLSMEESSEPLFWDYASRVFVTEALRMWVVVGDPIYDPKKSLQ